MTHLLVIDEKREISSQIEEVAKEQGHEVILAYSKASVLAYINTINFAGIFFIASSYNPTIFEYYNLISNKSILDKIPIIFVTPDDPAFHNNLKKSLKIEEIKFISLPIKKAELRNKINEVLTNRLNYQKNLMEKKYSELAFDSIQQFIILTDIKHNILWCNKYFLEKFQYNCDEITGAYFLDFIFTDENEKSNSREVFDFYIQSEIHNFEYRTNYFAENQSIITYGWKSMIFGVVENTLEYVLHIGEDISKKVELEGELHQLAIDLKISNIELNKINDEISEKNDLLISYNSKNVALQEVIQQYTPKATWQKAVHITSKGELKLPEEELELTVLFGDIQNFTKFSERHKPSEVIEHLNQVFSLISEQIYYHNGDVDKFIGDAFLAVFVNPSDAVECAIKINELLDNFNDDRIMNGVEPLFFRMGINTGHVIRGDVGGAFRKDYTIIGDPVNVAQRLESEAIPGQILISQRTYNFVKDNIIVSPPETLQLKGKNSQIIAYYVEGRTNYQNN